MFEPHDGARPPEDAATVNPDPNPPPAAPAQDGTAALPRAKTWGERILTVVWVIFCLELGLLMIVLPWTQFWMSNSLFASLPWLRPVVEHNFLRGAVSGLGVLDLWIGFSELGRGRRQR